MFLTYFFEIKAEITRENSEFKICENIWRVAQKLQNDFQVPTINFAIVI